MARVQQGDRRAVRMTQQDRVLYFQLLEQLRQYFQRLAVHVIGFEAASAAHIGNRRDLP